MSHPMTETGERSIGSVMSDLAGNLERLIRTEVKLVKATVSQTARGVARGSALVTIGAILAALTTLLLLLGLVARLAEQMKVWQAALLVAGGTAVIAALTIAIGVASIRRYAADNFDT